MNTQPTIDFYYGRVDSSNCEAGSGRLPDATLGLDEITRVFVTQMGLSITDAVTLIGAHSVGHAFPGNSGFGYVPGSPTPAPGGGGGGGGPPGGPPPGNPPRMLRGDPLKDKAREMIHELKRMLKRTNVPTTMPSYSPSTATPTFASPTRAPTPGTPMPTPNEVVGTAWDASSTVLNNQYYNSLLNQVPFTPIRPSLMPLIAILYLRVCLAALEKRP